jgi:hypothetical protein
MIDVTAAGDRIETLDDLGNGDVARFAYWEMQEKIAEKEERAWIKRAREIVKRYRDERPQAGPSITRFNILWSNVQTLLPTLYARTPKPDVERRFRDQDPVGRLAAVLLERCLAFAVDAFNFDAVMRAVVQDRLLPGRGVARVAYVPHFGEPIDADQDAGGGRQGEAAAGSQLPLRSQDDAAPDATPPDASMPEPALREVVYEEVKVLYVFWEDYREGPARQWNEVPWVRYRSYMSRDELIARFGRSKGHKVNLDHTPKGGPDSTRDDRPPDLHKKAVVHEVWDKSTGRVCWYAPGTPDLILDEQDDPLRLPDFFPNPDPVLATTSNDKRIPVSDYTQYQDQARELDTLTARIDRLTRALKVSGVYAGEEKQVLQQLIDEGTENRLIPVQDAAAWADKGGIANMIQWMPIQQVAETLIQLYNARDRVKFALYEITGIGDIVRGMTNPYETLGAQELKANFANRRIVPQQKDVARFARDLLRLMGAVIAEHFSAKTIAMISGYPQLDPVPNLPSPPNPPMTTPARAPGVAAAGIPPVPAPAGPFVLPVPGGRAAQAAPSADASAAYQQALTQWQQNAQRVQAVIASNLRKQQQFDAAVALLRQDGAHGFRIDIESDSTIAPDEQAEKQARVEFLSQMVPLLEQVVPLAMGNPALASVCREITLFAARGFRIARTLEETLEQAFDALAQMPPSPKSSPADAGNAVRAADGAALAVRAHEIDAKAQVEHEKNAIAAARLASEQQRDQLKLAAQAADDQAKLALAAEKLEADKAFRGVQSGAMAARAAQGLA